MVGAPDMAEQGGYVKTPVGSFEKTFSDAARLGFDGVELLYAKRITGDNYAIRQAVQKTNVKVAGFNSGRLFFDHGLVLLCGNSRECGLTRQAIYSLISLAASYSGPINIGMFRGMPTTPDDGPSKTQLVRIMRELADYASKLGVMLLIEPANKVEFPFISSTREGVDFVERIDHPHVGMMLDTFHMAMENEDMCKSIEMAMPYLHHVHFLDLDRNPPSPLSTGIDIPSVISSLSSLGYQHHLSMPLMKVTEQMSTAAVVGYLRSVIEKA
jgi:sugar phosphate isomerase/epimerase